MARIVSIGSALQKRRQEAVLPEAAAENQDIIHIRGGNMFCGTQPTDHGGKQNTLCIGDHNSYDVKDHLGQHTLRICQQRDTV